MFDFLFNPQGRVSRKGFALGFLLPWLVLTQLLPLVLPANPIVALVVGLIGLFYLWPSFVAVPVKRWHDLGRTGWFQVIIPILGLIGIALVVAGMIGAFGGDMEAFSQAFESANGNAEIYGLIWQSSRQSPIAVLGMALFFAYAIEFIVFCLLRGQRGENRFGQDPLLSGRGFAD